jgi:hypothetical protein
VRKDEVVVQTKTKMASVMTCNHSDAPIPMPATTIHLQSLMIEVVWYVAPDRLVKVEMIVASIQMVDHVETKE